MYVRLAPQGNGEARESLQKIAEEALAAKERALTVGLDDLPALDADVMGGLIVALRRMREAGGSVALHVTRPDLLGALAVSGLDRVFKIVAQPEHVEPEKPSAAKRGAGSARRIAGGLAGIFGALLVLGTGHAAIGAMLVGVR